MRLETFALERFQSIWENRVAWNVAESGVQPLRVSELIAGPENHDALLELDLGYPQTNGTVELRETIAGMYPGATAEHVQVTNGGSEANCILLMRLVQPGDEIVFLTPNYMQAAGLARGLGATVRPWRLRETAAENSRAAEPAYALTAEHADTLAAEHAEYADPRKLKWAVDLDELQALVTPKTRAILLCNPNNPTGARLDAATLDEICRIASTVGAWVVDDEIYRGAEREAEDTPTVWGRYERAVVSSGLSKAYGLPGLRIGWIVAPPELVADLWSIHDYTTIAPGGINDRLARIALEPSRRATLLARTRGIIRANYPIVRRWIERQEGLSHIPPEAGAIAFVRHTHPFRSSELTERLRAERSVLLVPGDYFDLDGYLRIGFGSDPKHLESALTLIGEFLSSVGAHAR
jgi:aspartate/methionine/tyrosine aminotransferase